jgi:co-chaperonin GroES (HSP10)
MTQAVGEHILVILPNRKKATDGGIILPDAIGQKFCYGRVLSAGEEVDVTAGAYVIFDHRGHAEINLDPIKDDGVVCIHKTMVYAVISRSELEERNLPLP